VKNLKIFAKFGQTYLKILTKICRILFAFIHAMQNGQKILVTFIITLTKI